MARPIDLLQTLISATNPANSAVTAQVTDSQLQLLVQALLDANSALIDRFVTLLEKIATDLVGADPSQLQGEAEELLRLIIQAAEKAIEKLLAMLEQLQTRILESFLPAQN